MCREHDRSLLSISLLSPLLVSERRYHHLLAVCCRFPLCCPHMTGAWLETFCCVSFGHLLLDSVQTSPWWTTDELVDGEGNVCMVSGKAWTDSLSWAMLRSMCTRLQKVVCCFRFDGLVEGSPTDSFKSVKQKQDHKRMCKFIETWLNWNTYALIFSMSSETVDLIKGIKFFRVYTQIKLMMYRKGTALWR